MSVTEKCKRLISGALSLILALGNVLWSVCARSWTGSGNFLGQQCRKKLSVFQLTLKRRMRRR